MPGVRFSLSSLHACTPPPTAVTYHQVKQAERETERDRERERERERDGERGRDRERERERDWYIPA